MTRYLALRTGQALLVLWAAFTLSTAAVSATPEQLRDLQQAGWSTEDIVTLSQLVAFVNFQSRLLRGYRLIAARDVKTHPALSAVAGSWHTQPQTHSGKAASQAFTQAELGWEPWLMRNRWSTITKSNRRCWRALAIRISTTSACWDATCRYWSSGR